MQTHLTESAGVWNSELGEFISSEHQRLAQVLADYNPYYSLAFIPPKDRVTEQERSKPFAIIDSSPGKPRHVMRYLSEMEMRDTQGVLQWVFEGDLNRTRPGDLLAKLEAKDAARRLLSMKAEEERLAEEADKLAFIARTPLHKFNVDGLKLSDY